MFLSSFYKEWLVSVAVNVAHCVMTWWDDFRKGFAHIGELRSLIHTNVNILSLTATGNVINS